MPRYEYSPSTVRSSFETFPKDDYEFVIGEPKTFKGTSKKGTENFGVSVSLVIGTGSYQGKRANYRMFLQSEGGQSFAKQFQMAALGYGKGSAEEDRFDEEWGHKDWSLDFDTGGLGDAWRELTGRRVVGHLDITMGENDAQFQQFAGWSPLK